MKLRPYQVTAIEKLAHRHITVLPTGTGKTAIFCQIAADAEGRTIILVHREELIEQTVNALRRVTNKTVGVVQGPRNEWKKDIVVAMQQTARTDKRLAKIPACTVLIVDEAHRYTTKKSCAILDTCEEQGAQIYGFTATPHINQKPIYGPGRPFVDISYRRSIPAMIREGYLSDVRAKSVVFDDLDLDSVRIDAKARDYSAGDLGDKLSAIKAPFRIAEAWKQHASDRKRTIVFLPTVELAQETAACFAATGAEVVEVYGNTPAAERRKRIDAIRKGDADVLVNVLVGAEGFDVPEIDCVVQARPTKSWTLYTQSVGRGLRIAPGKEDCLVLDISGSSAQHDIASLPRVLEVPLDKKGKLTARQVLEDEEKKERTGPEIDTSAAVLHETLLYAPIRWTQWHEEWIATLDRDYVVVIAPVDDEETGEIFHGVFRTHLRTGDEKEVGIYHYANEAQEEAEEYVREHGDSKLFRRAEGWRNRPPTDGQLRWFRNVPADKRPKTRGEASEQITLALYRKLRR